MSMEEMRSKLDGFKEEMTGNSDEAQVKDRDSELVEAISKSLKKSSNKDCIKTVLRAIDQYADKIKKEYEELEKGFILKMMYMQFQTQPFIRVWRFLDLILVC